MKISARNRNHGFSLVETLFSAAIAVIMFSLALKLFLSATQLNARGDLILENMRERAEMQRLFRGIAHEGVAVLESAGPYTASNQLALLELHAGPAVERRVAALGALDAPNTMTLQIFYPDNAAQPVERRHTVALPLAHLSLNATTPADGGRPLLTLRYALEGRGDVSNRQTTVVAALHARPIP